VDATLKAVVSLIGSPDVEARCAALLVLSHIKAADARVVRTIGELLGSKNVVVRDFAVGYFEQVRPPDAVAHLIPLLDSQDEALRQRVVAILAEYGHVAIVAAKHLLTDAPRRRLTAIIDLCGRVRDSAALDLLFAFMGGDDFDTHRTACDVLLSVIPALDARARADLFARTDALARSAAGQRAARVAAAKLFGALGDPKARRRLFALLDPENPPAVRTHAVAALVQCLRGQQLTAGEIEAVFPLLDEDDEAGILRPAMHLLEEQTLDRSALGQLNRLADSPQPLVRRFAVQKLAGFESGAVVRTLIGYLTDDSYARRDQAAASLKKLPAARAALLKELLACDDERKAWTIAEILLTHDRTWRRATLDALWGRLAGALETRQDRLHTAYFHFLHALDAPWLAARIRSRAEAHRKKKDYVNNIKWLMLLKDSPAFDVEAKFALAIAELKSHPRRSTAPLRRHDPALELIRDLAHSAFPASERLRKERALTPEDQFYIAFNLAEGSAEEKAVARELLDHLAARHARSKIGKASKNKLRLLSNT
jgi:HEAT repeat protein